jgi:prepilin-type N-terminal cleavage/methylation domain-containing protein
MKTKPIQPNSTGRAAAATRGFTLIEMMVVLALLGVVLMITVNISNGSLDAIRRTQSQVVMDRIAATTLDSIALDLQQRIVRREATVRVDKHAGNDEMVLLTIRSGYPMVAANPDRRVSKVHYQVKGNRLLHASSGYEFGGPTSEPREEAGRLQLHGVPLDGPTPLPDAWFETLVSGVIRLELSALATSGQQTTLADPPLGLRNTEAVVATVVVMDPARTRMLTDEQRARIAREFPDARDGALPFDEWAAIESRLTQRIPASEIPHVALRHLRVYQRVIPLRTTNLP